MPKLGWIGVRNCGINKVEELSKDKLKCALQLKFVGAKYTWV